MSVLAGVAKLADASDLGSEGVSFPGHAPCRFDPDLPHHLSAHFQCIGIVKPVE